MILVKEDNLESVNWEQSLASLADGAEILQSTIWRQIAMSEKHGVLRFVWQEKEKNVALAQIIVTSRLGFKSWYLPRGPIFLSAENEESLWMQLIIDLKREAKLQDVMAIRFEPENWSLPGEKFGQKIKSIQPEKSLFLDLSHSEDELLSQMHPKTRYNIRLAEKKGVEIIAGNSDDLLEFWHLLQVTTSRDGFRGHSLAHYQKLLEQGKGAIELWLARRDGELLAAGLFSFYNGRAVYLHGASSDENRRYMAPYLLQWRMIQRARSFSCHYYDFYGIDEIKWPGVTRFKRGFGGEERIYPGSFLLVISPWRQLLYTLFSRLAALVRF